MPGLGIAPGPGGLQQALGHPAAGTGGGFNRLSGGRLICTGASFRQVSISPNLRLNRIVLGESGCSGAFLALLMAIDPGQRSGGDAPGTRPGWGPVAGSAGSGAVSGMMGGDHSRQASGGTAVAVGVSVTIKHGPEG